MDASSAEILIPSPEDCFCALSAYVLSLQQLLIAARPPGSPTYFMFFQAVIYFAGGTYWRGANYTLGSPEEVQERLGRIQPDMAFDTVKLYKLGWPGQRVEILAHKMHIMRQPPQVFDWVPTS